MKYTLLKPIRWFWNHKNNYVSSSLSLAVPSPSIPDFSFVTAITDQADLGDCSGQSACSTRAYNKGNAYDPNQYYLDELAFFNSTNLARGVDLKTQVATGVKTGFVIQGTTTHTDNASAYLQIVPNNGQDMFSSIVSAMFQNQVPAMVGLPWYESWTTGQQGIVPNTSLGLRGGHSVKIAGLKTINNVQYLIVQNSWGIYAQGSDNGLYYFNRALVNQWFNAYGCFIWVDSVDFQVKTLGLLSALYVNLLDLLGSAGNTIGSPPVVPIPNPSIAMWAQAIQKAEGWKEGSVSYTHNNPGNLKYSTLTASWGAKQSTPATDGGTFCYFPDYQTGLTALCNFLQLGKENQLIAFHQARTLGAFTKIYAGNPPKGYIDTICEELKVGAGFNVSNFT
jgi:hypothetical protein